MGAAIVIVGVLAFWGGMQYGTNSAASNQSGGRAGQFSSARGGRLGGGGGNTFGTIISKDAASMTVQLGGMGSTTPSGTGSRLVFIDSKTEVSKSVAGALTDLSVGQQVVVTGTQNSDGSVTAQMVQVRPANMQRPSGQ